MPLVRYEVRCEHSLANPELYRTAGQDDSEGLLEGVAMAGLVGIVRQLGDLAEFAAEIFHDLHDDIMTVVSRGRNLKARVARLEVDLPAVEKALLAESSQFKFAYSARSKWRAPLPMDQNFCAQGELPRFVSNFYDDCRGPPRLFLLDKFDEAGRGACVKRYTDPTFFRLSWATSQLTKAEQLRREREAESLRKSTAGLNNAGPKIYARERLSSALFENLEGFTGDFTPELRSRRLDRVFEVSAEAVLTPDGPRSPEEPRSPDLRATFRKQLHPLPQVVQGPVLAPLKLTAKDIENAKLGRRSFNNEEALNSDDESEFFVDAMTTMGSDPDSEPGSRTRWEVESVQSRFASESDFPGTESLNHSVLKAHVEAHRHSPPRTSDEVDYDEDFARRLRVEELGSPGAGFDSVRAWEDAGGRRYEEFGSVDATFEHASVASFDEDSQNGLAIVAQSVLQEESLPSKLSDKLPDKPSRRSGEVDYYDEAFARRLGLGGLGSPVAGFGTVREWEDADGRRYEESVDAAFEHASVASFDEDLQNGLAIVAQSVLQEESLPSKLSDKLPDRLPDRLPDKPSRRSGEVDYYDEAFARRLGLGGLGSPVAGFGTVREWEDGGGRRYEESVDAAFEHASVASFDEDSQNGLAIVAQTVLREESLPSKLSDNRPPRKVDHDEVFARRLGLGGLGSPVAGFGAVRAWEDAGGRPSEESGSVDANFEHASVASFDEDSQNGLAIVAQSVLQEEYLPLKLSDNKPPRNVDYDGAFARRLGLGRLGSPVAGFGTVSAWEDAGGQRYEESGSVDATFEHAPVASFDEDSQKSLAIVAQNVLLEECLPSKLSDKLPDKPPRKVDHDEVFARRLGLQERESPVAGLAIVAQSVREESLPSKLSDKLSDKPPRISDEDHDGDFARRLGLQALGSPFAGFDTVREREDAGGRSYEEPGSGDAIFEHASIASFEEDSQNGCAIVAQNVLQEESLPSKLSDKLPDKPPRISDEVEHDEDFARILGLGRLGLGSPVAGFGTVREWEDSGDRPYEESGSVDATFEHASVASFDEDSQKSRAIVAQSVHEEPLPSILSDKPPRISDEVDQDGDFARRLGLEALGSPFEESGSGSATIEHASVASFDEDSQNGLAIVAQSVREESLPSKLSDKLSDKPPRISDEDHDGDFARRLGLGGLGSPVAGFDTVREWEDAGGRPYEESSSGDATIEHASIASFEEDSQNGLAIVAQNVLQEEPLPSKLPDKLPDKPPDSLSDKAPATLSDKVPATLSDKVPATLSDKVPATLSDKVPATLSDKLPATPSDKLPDTLSDKLPYENPVDKLPSVLPDNLPDGLSDKRSDKLSDKMPNKSPAKSSAKSPAKSPTKSPAKSSAKSPTKSPAKSSAKSPTKSPAKSAVKSRTKSPAKSPTQSPVKSAAKSPVKLPEKPSYQSHESVSLQDVFRPSVRVRPIVASIEARAQSLAVENNNKPPPQLAGKDEVSQLVVLNPSSPVTTPRNRRLWAKDNATQVHSSILQLADMDQREGTNGGSEPSNTVLRVQSEGDSTTSLAIFPRELKFSSSNTSSPCSNEEEDGYTSSASSSPKGLPNFCALLSPSESPPRVAEGLMGPPSLFLTDSHFDTKIPKAPPITPLLSDSPSVSRSSSINIKPSVVGASRSPRGNVMLSSSLPPQIIGGPVASDSDKLKNVPAISPRGVSGNGVLQLEPSRNQSSTLPNPVPRPRTWVNRSESNVAATLRAIRQAAVVASDDDTGSECRSDC